MSEAPKGKEPKDLSDLSPDHQNAISVLSLYAVYEKLLSSEAITREVFNEYLSKLTVFEQKILTVFLAKESELVKAIQGKVEGSAGEGEGGNKS